MGPSVMDEVERNGYYAAIKKTQDKVSYTNKERRLAGWLRQSMASLQNSPSISRFPNSLPQLTPQKQTLHCGRRQRTEPPTCSTSQDGHGRRQLLTIGVTTTCISLGTENSISFAAEGKKGFLPVLDKKDGYSFTYPFGWQEVTIEGQDKVFKDVIEPLESVSVNLFPTSKQDIRDFGPPQEVAETLIKKVLAPPTQKTKLIQAEEHEVDGKIYYRFEFVAQAPNYTRHALSTISIGNGKFYTLTTGANERRWGKMKDKLQQVIESFKIFTVFET